MTNFHTRKEIMDLQNKNVVITGASGGFGRALCRLFAKKQANVIATDIDANALKKLKSDLQDEGFSIKTQRLDVTKTEDFEKFNAQLREKNIFPDVWINNAGISYPEAFSKTDAGLFDKIIDVNFRGVVNGTRAAFESMLVRRVGTVVNIASASGHLPVPFLSSYAASKHAVVGFTRSLQVELYQQASPVKMILVSPGFADTGIMKTNREFSVPKTMKWAVSTPDAVARDIVKAVEKGSEEIYPGLSASLFLSLYRFTPKSIFRLASRALTARNTRELLGLEGIRSR